ncbi:MAG: hypothetical protein AB1480_03800 [Nitrospirota bacterium]
MKIGVIGVKQGIILYAGVEKGGKKQASERAQRRKELLEKKGLEVHIIENPDMRRIRLYDSWRGEPCRQ